MKLDDSVKLNEIIRLGSELNDVQDLDILLERILREARKFVSADAGSIQIRNENELIFSHVQTESLERLLPPGKKLIYTTLRVPINKKSLSGYAATTGEILNIPDVYKIPADAPYKFDPSYDKKSNFKTTSSLTVPLKTGRDNVIGVMQIINAMDRKGKVIPFSENDEMYVRHFAGTASMIIQKAQMTRAIILRMISMAELRDPKETGAHVNRVASYSVEIYEKWAKNHGVPDDQMDKNRDVLRMAAMLHDVGKVAISDLILKKPARFTEEEFEVMKSHTVHGARLFLHKQSEFDEVSSTVALRHHENWDGTGYPGYIDVDTGKVLEADSKGKAAGLKGEEIPLYGRIVSLADVYDALSSKRVYKEAWGEKDVLNEIKVSSGKKFDPELVDVFFDTLDLLRSVGTRYPDSE